MRHDGLLAVEYDEDRDVLTVEGVQYSGAVFRGIALGKPGHWYQYDRDEEGAVVVTEVLRIPSMCLDLDADCREVENPATCHAHDPGRGACPFTGPTTMGRAQPRPAPKSSQTAADSPEQGGKT